MEPGEESRDCKLLVQVDGANLRPFSERSKAEDIVGTRIAELAGGVGRVGGRKEITSCKITAATFRRLRNSRGQVNEFLPLPFIADNSARRDSPV